MGEGLVVLRVAAGGTSLKDIEPTLKDLHHQMCVCVCVCSLITFWMIFMFRYKKGNLEC